MSISSAYRFIFFVKIFKKLCIYIYKNLLVYDVELDKSYFGVKRVRAKRGCGTAGKTPVFSLLKRDGNSLTSFLKH